MSSTSTLDYVALTAATHNNSLPEPVQARARHLLNQASSEVGFIENEIARMQVILNDLHSRRHNKLAEIELYKSALSPLRNLPNELLSLIFTLCCSETITIPYKLDQQQWLLTRVCSKWRNVSLSVPEIWNNIRIYHPAHGYVIGGRHIAHPIPHSVFVQMVEEVLLRSGRVPLSLSILDEDATDSAYPLAPFMPHLARIKELHLQNAPRTVKAFLALQPHLVPSLQTLQLSDQSKVDIFDGGVLQSAPSLKKVEYTSYRVLLGWILKLPLAQLTHLSIPFSMLRPTQVRTILQLAPNLVDCAFAVGAHLGSPQSNSPLQPDLSMALVHNLHTLRLTVFGTDNEIPALQSLVLPNLRHIAFQTGQEREWDQRWAPMILHSGSIETLILRDTIISPPQLEHLLQLSPYVSKLDVSSGRMMTSSILQKIARGELAPRLTALRCLIESTTMGELAFEQHLDMLEQRRMDTTPGTHIEKVQFLLFGVEDMNLMYPGVQPRVNRMKTVGWDIVISCPSIRIF